MSEMYGVIISKTGYIMGRDSDFEKCCKVADKSIMHCVVRTLPKGAKAGMFLKDGKLYKDKPKDD